MLCVDSYISNTHMTIIGRLTHMLYQRWNRQQIPQEATWKLCLRSLFRSWKNDYAGRDTRLPLQNGTYVATVSLFTSGAGNANFWDICFSTSPVFWDLSPSSDFSNYFFHNWEKQSIFFSFQNSHSSKGKDAQPALFPHILLAPPHMREKVSYAQMCPMCTKNSTKMVCWIIKRKDFAISSYVLGIWGWCGIYLE